MSKNKTINQDNGKETFQKKIDMRSTVNYYEDQILIWREEVQQLSYEEALKKLDLVLYELENDETSLEEIQSLYLKGKIYLDYCDNLLNSAEQDVKELSINKFI